MRVSRQRRPLPSRCLLTEEVRLGHAGAVGKESIDVLLVEVRREQPGDGVLVYADSSWAEAERSFKRTPVIGKVLVGSSDAYLYQFDAFSPLPTTRVQLGDGGSAVSPATRRR